MTITVENGVLFDVLKCQCLLYCREKVPEALVSCDTGAGDLRRDAVSD